MSLGLVKGRLVGPCAGAIFFFLAVGLIDGGKVLVVVDLDDDDDEEEEEEDDPGCAGDF